MSRMFTIADQVELNPMSPNDPRAVRAKRRAEQKAGRALSFREWFDLSADAVNKDLSVSRTERLRGFPEP